METINTGNTSKIDYIYSQLNDDAEIEEFRKTIAAKENDHLFELYLTYLCMHYAARGHRQEVKKGKSINLDIINPEIGRYLYLLMKFQISEGYSINLINNYSLISSLDSYTRMLLSSQHLTINFLPSQSEYYIADHGNETRFEPDHITLDYNYFSSPDPGQEVVYFPFPLHPLQYENGNVNNLEHFRNKRKLIRVFFAGNTNQDLYVQLDNRFGLIQRHAAIDEVNRHLQDQIINVENTDAYARLLEAEYINKIVLSDSSKNHIHSDDWLARLSLSDFYLALPGIAMPFSHNVVEAMAVGTIPILEYGSYFNPPLQDQVNCIQYKGKNGLIRVLQEMLSLDRSEINRLRRDVIEYYQMNVTPRAFMEKLATLKQNKTGNIKIILNAEHESIRLFFNGNDMTAGTKPGMAD